jgi:peptidyl-tRNA hydrolase, PTH1 family
MEIKLVAGLGNPGSKYENTRHNLGFRVLDTVALKNSLKWKSWKDSTLICFMELEDRKIVLAKPQTYMNNSGMPLKSLADYYKIAVEEVFVVFDDFSMPLEKLRIRLSGSAGGHNGVSSIMENLGSKDFSRLRLGIGPVKENIDPADFVLTSFSSSENQAVLNMIEKAAQVTEIVIKEGINKAASFLSRENKEQE